MVDELDLDPLARGTRDLLKEAEIRNNPSALKADNWVPGCGRQGPN